MDFKTIAQELHRAAKETKPVAQISETEDFNIEEAYDIQQKLVAERVEEGHPIVGLKMGFTSEAKMKQMGVHDMIWGRLTKDMKIGNGGSVSIGQYIHPRAEPEIAFRISRDIHSEIALEDLGDHVDGIAAAIEVIDSRFQDFKFNLNDVIADNCSSTGFVVGDWKSPDRSIDDLMMRLSFDEETVAQGSSNAILGDPWIALQAATRLAAEYGEPIKAGYIILAGAATPAQFMKKGQQIRAQVERLGEVSFETMD